jgi:hypothetical protein
MIKPCGEGMILTELFPTTGFSVEEALSTRREVDGNNQRQNFDPPFCFKVHAEKRN